jgi:plastocyanin
MVAARGPPRVTRRAQRARRTSAAIVLGVALASGTFGCGGDSSSASDNATTEAATTEGATTSEAGGSTSGLKGETGPGFTIEVSLDGEDAETIKADTYTLEVEDKSDMHNFHLIGPGVDEEVTDVPFVGKKTVTVTLQKGTYTYQCDPHAASGMKGTFAVT